VIRGQVANLSLGGALIKGLNAILPEHALVVLKFQADQEQVQLDGELTSRVVHTITESIEAGEISSIGVQFQNPVKEIKAQLDPLLPTFSLPKSKE